MSRMFEFGVHRDYWLNANQRLHWAQRKTRTAHLRRKAELLARANLSRGGNPAATPVHIVATVSTPTNSRFDPPNAAPTVKALIDGLVDAGVIPDDDHHHVPRVSFERGPKTGEPGFYRIVLDLQEVNTDGD